ncbi:MAG: hypothetical protein JW908_06615 [Anaerolineales bacterium]|nr:hypothetical protein [Anaerolineales bacterium]
MKTNRPFSSALKSPKFLLLILIALPVILGCSLSSYLGFNPTPTIAPTQPPEVTVMVVVQSPTPEMVLPPTETPEPTPTEQPTETAQPVVPTDTEIVIEVPDFIEVANIQAFNWYFANSTKCKDEKEGCWFLTTYKQEGSLEPRDFYYIDPTWENPHLVFWHKFISDGYSYFGFVETTGDTEVGWTQIKGYKDSNFSWKEEAIDISQYKGSEILIRIMFVPTIDTFSPQQKAKYNAHDWAIASIRIVPDYAP